MIVEFSNVLVQTDTKTNGEPEIEPHIINGFRYNWNMRSELMIVNETMREWITRKELEINGRLKKMGNDIDGVVIYDWQPCLPMIQIDSNDKMYTIIDKDGKKKQYGAGIMRYAYLDKTKKLNE